MPQVRHAMEALIRQTYRNFEVIVQDGGSTDGTVEYLRSLSGLARLDIVSEPDSGIGQAYNRGLARVTGDIVCFMAADEYLDHDALEKGIRWFSQYPDAVVVYGGVRLTDEKGRVFQDFIPPDFDFMKVMHNEIVLPMAAVFVHRQRVGSELYYDESLKTCPDYDFWLRVGSKWESTQFVLVPETILTALADRTSMSFRAESFTQFTTDKLFVLNRYLATRSEESDVAALQATASTGILCWAAENVLWLEGVSSDFLKWCREAARFDPHSARLADLARTSEAFDIDSSGQFLLKPPPQPPAPVGPTQRIDGVLKLEETHTQIYWDGATVERDSATRITTAFAPWGYSAVIPLTPGDEPKTDWYWIKLNVRVLSGEVGIGLLAADQIHNEQVIATENGRLDVYLRLNQADAAGVMVRNGARPGAAAIEIFDGSVVVQRVGR